MYVGGLTDVSISKVLKWVITLYPSLPDFCKGFSERPGRCGWHLMPVGIYVTTGHEVYSLYIGGGTGQASQTQG